VGIEWFRDLSIVIMGFVTTAVLIFTAVLVYRLYRKMKSTLLLVEAASKIACDTATLVQQGIKDTVTLVQEGIRPLLPILALIRGIRRGFESISKMLEKESNEGGNSDE
jgi:hypothetical protein